MEHPNDLTARPTARSRRVRPSYVAMALVSLLIVVVVIAVTTRTVYGKSAKNVAPAANKATEGPTDSPTESAPTELVEGTAANKATEGPTDTPTESESTEPVEGTAANKATEGPIDSPTESAPTELVEGTVGGVDHYHCAALWGKGRIGCGPPSWSLILEGELET